MEHGQGSGGSDTLEAYRNQAKLILKKLSGKSTAKMSVESNPYVFQ